MRRSWRARRFHRGISLVIRGEGRGLEGRAETCADSLLTIQGSSSTTATSYVVLTPPASPDLTHNSAQVLDCQVPPKLLERCPLKTDREFTHMRYTAATCDVRAASPPESERANTAALAQPNDFLAERYSLRQILYETPRRTELFLVLTMYNVRYTSLSLRTALTRKVGGRGALLPHDARSHE